MIGRFIGKYQFLSNFYGRRPTIEHLFQASKTDDERWKNIILSAKTAYEARFIGKYKLPKRLMKKNWSKIRRRVMYEIVFKEYLKDADRMVRLIATGDEKLVHGVTWHDNFWGDCSCRGCRHKTKHNYHGKILMRVRKELTFK